MSCHLDMSRLQFLRRHRRPLAWLATALIVVSLAGALGQCPAMGSMLLGSLAADASAQPMVPSEMPCADCTAGGDIALPAPDAANLHAELTAVAVLALVLAGSLLARTIPKTIPIPRRPFLAIRPRSLKFCVLRI